MKRVLIFFFLMNTSCMGDMYFGDANVRIYDPDKRFLNHPISNADTYSDLEVLDSHEAVRSPFLRFASKGSRCVDAMRGEYLVLSDYPVHCPSMALAINSMRAGKSIPGILVFEKDDLNITKKYCFSDLEKGCIQVDFDIKIEGH